MTALNRLIVKSHPVRKDDAFPSGILSFYHPTPMIEMTSMKSDEMSFVALRDSQVRAGIIREKSFCVISNANFQYAIHISDLRKECFLVLTFMPELQIDFLF